MINKTIMTAFLMVSCFHPLVAEEDNFVTDIVEKYSESVVLVQAGRYGDDDISFGSGVIVNNGRMIITNIHVVTGADKVWIVFPDETEMTVKGYVRADEDHDLVSIKLTEKKKPAFPVRIKPSHNVKIGQKVVAIGNPRGLTTTVSEGIISSKRKMDDGTVLLQTTAPISHGSSGGGLFNSDGDLIVITTFTYRESQNLNFDFSGELIYPLLNDRRISPFKKLKTNLFAVDPSPADRLPASKTIYVTTSGKKYHKRGCSYLRKSAIPLQLNEATARYLPCKRCW